MYCYAVWGIAAKPALVSLTVRPSPSRDVAPPLVSLVYILNLWNLPVSLLICPTHYTSTHLLNNLYLWDNTLATKEAFQYICIVGKMV